VRNLAESLHSSSTHILSTITRTGVITAAPMNGKLWGTRSPAIYLTAIGVDPRMYAIFSINSKQRLKPSAVTQRTTPFQHPNLNPRP